MEIRVINQPFWFAQTPYVLARNVLGPENLPQSRGTKIVPGIQLLLGWGRVEETE